jgi:periplasmic protein CpxP/Spy
MKIAAIPATLLFSAGLLCAGPVFAQTDAPPPTPAQADGAPPPPMGHHRGGPEHRVEMLQHSLNLSPDQTTQVKALLDDERSKMEALHGNTALAPEDRRTQMMAVRQDTNTKVRALLTPDQVTKFDAMQARMRDRRPGGPDGPPPPPPAPGAAPGER